MFFLDKLVKEFNDQVQWAPCVLTSELPPDPTSSNIATGGDPQDFLQDAKDYAPQELKNYQTWNSTMINSLLPNVTTTYQQRFQQFSQDLVQYLRDQKGKTNDIFDENHEQRPIPVEARKSRYNVDQAESTKESKQHPTIKDAELTTLLEARETRNSDFWVYLPDDEENKLHHFYAPDDPDIERPRSYKDIPEIYNDLYISRIFDPESALKRWIITESNKKINKNDANQRLMALIELKEKKTAEINRKIQSWFYTGPNVTMPIEWSAPEFDNLIYYDELEMIFQRYWWVNIGSKYFGNAVWIPECGDFSVESTKTRLRKEVENLIQKNKKRSYKNKKNNKKQLL